jgi:hypothetical protein
MTGNTDRLLKYSGNTSSTLLVLVFVRRDYEGVILSLIDVYPLVEH